MPEVSVFELVGGQAFFDALVDHFYAARRDWIPCCGASIPRTSRPASVGSGCSSAQYWGGPPTTATRRAILACACGTRRSRIGEAAREAWVAAMLAARRRRRRARSRQRRDAGVLQDGGDRDDQPRGATSLGGVSKRQREGEAGATASARSARRAPTSRRNAIRAGPPLARPPGAGRDPAPAVRARCARADAGGAARRVRRSHAHRGPRRGEVLLETRRRPCGLGITTDELDRICHEACIARGWLPEPAALQGFPEVALHVGERSHLPRHPRRPRAARRRHRQLRRHDLLDRRPRRLQCDVPRRRRRRRRPPPRARHEGSVVEGHRRRCAPARAHQRRSGARSKSTPKRTTSASCARSSATGLGEEFHTAPSVPHFYDPHADPSSRRA